MSIYQGENIVWVIEWLRHNSKSGRVWKIKEIFHTKAKAFEAIIQYRFAATRETGNHGGWNVEYRIVPYTERGDYETRIEVVDEQVAGYGSFGGL